MTEKTTTGSCLCGRIKLTITGALRPVVACHCTQCRKQSGHYYAATNAPDEAIAIEGESFLTWYQSSDSAKRGFCSVCGSVLMWKHDKDDFTSVLAGCLDQPTGVRLEKHIFVADKGDYYEIDDGLPQS